MIPRNRSAATPNRFKTLRVAILLLILLVVALTTWQDRYRSTRRREPLFVAIYPIIAADASAVTRRYVDASDAQRFPEGFGDARQVPLYPQSKAEIMAGRRMLAPDRWEQASSLDEVVVGTGTALEIRWAR